LLYTILMNSKDTKDEVNFLDADTWPEILRQHLEDARGDQGSKARELALVRLSPFHHLHTPPQQIIFSVARVCRCVCVCVCVCVYVSVSVSVSVSV